jgi:hypothetical protein
MPAILRGILRGRIISWHAGCLSTGNSLTGMELANMLMRVFPARVGNVQAHEQPLT